MGIYHRDDSPLWWMVIERPGQKALRRSTGIPWDAGDEQLRRAAQRVYALAKARETLGTTEVKKPIIDFDSHAAWYLTNVVPHHRGASKEASMVKRLRGDFSHIDDLRQIDASAAIEWMTRRKKDVVASTVNRELDVLKSILARAVPKYLERPPLGAVRRFRVEESEPRVLTLEDERKLLDVCSPAESALIIMAIDTLLRLSSVVNLQWAQVRLAQGVIVPLNAKVSIDTVPITRRLDEALGELVKTNAYVFPWLHDGKGETAAKNATIRLFDLLCQKAGLPHGRAAKGLTFHCLRHTGATRALQKGASVRTVMKLGGWKDERSVIRYTHATDADVRKAAESIGGKPLAFAKRKA